MLVLGVTLFGVRDLMPSESYDFFFNMYYSKDCIAEDGAVGGFGGAESEGFGGRRAALLLA